MSLAFDDLGHPAIAYYDADPSNLKFAIQGKKGMEAAVIREGLASTAQGPDTVEQVIASTISRERPQYERYLSFLGTLGNNAPFIGLFGTVLGIIRAFQELGTQGSASLRAVGPGISEALLYRHFRGKDERYEELQRFCLRDTMTAAEYDGLMAQMGHGVALATAKVVAGGLGIALHLAAVHRVVGVEPFVQLVGPGDLAAAVGRAARLADRDLALLHVGNESPLHAAALALAGPQYPETPVIVRFGDSVVLVTACRAAWSRSRLP